MVDYEGMQEAIASNLRAERARRDMSGERFAELMGVTINTVSNWENKTATPSIKTCCKMANVLGCRFSDIVSERAV